MRLFVYPYIPSGVMQKKLALSCASAVLLALVSLHHATAQAQQLQAIGQKDATAIKPVNQTVTVQDKYQKLLDAGIFSVSNTPTNFDATMTRAQFAAVMAKLQTLSPHAGSAPFSDVDPMLTSGVIPNKPGLVEGYSGDDKPATLAEVIASLSKAGIFDQAESDQLVAKLKINGVVIPNTGEAGTVSPATNAEILFAVNSVVAGVVAERVPTLGAVATTSGISEGLSSEALAALSLALSAASAASSSANNIALENTTKPGANYTVVLPRSNWPTNLNATYSGRLTGTLNDSSLVGGNLNMNVNFATIRNAATIPGSVLFDNGKGSASLNLVQFNGFVGGGMSGTYNGQAMTGNIINGQFYGPAAEAVKGSWSMATPTVSGGGVFAANR